MAESMKQVKFERKRAEIKLQTEALKIKNEANHMMKINNQKRNSIIMPEKLMTKFAVFV